MQKKSNIVNLKKLDPDANQKEMFDPNPIVGFATWLFV